MEIQQKRNSNRTRFEFGEEELRYYVQDSSGSRSFSVAYTDISRDRQTLQERNAWLRNAGLLWLALGALVTVMRWFESHTVSPSIWLLVGAVAYAAYRLRTTSFTLVPSGKGNLLVISGVDGERILTEIDTRRAKQFRAEYDFMPDGDTAEQHRRRFQWLHREGALSDEELKQRLALVDTTDPARFDEIAAAAGSRLN
jgi:hypothetical protein